MANVLRDQLLDEPVDFNARAMLADKVELPNRMYRAESVMEITGLGRSVLYAAVREGRFPPPVCIGFGAARNSSAAWIGSEIEAWLNQRIAERNRAYLERCGIDTGIDGK